MPVRELMVVINTGSTSTKIAVYSGDTCVATATLSHSGEELAASREVVSQLPHRVAVVRRFLENHNIEPELLACVVARGGLLRPVRSGAYRVNEDMLQDLRDGVGGRHASNLGALIAWEIGLRGRIPSYIVDPVSVDEYAPQARLSGVPAVPRKSLLHALNIRACARRAAADLKADLGDLFLVIAHLGSGFSISPCYKGLMVDANNSNEEGPFTVERAGTLPALYLLDLFRQFGGIDDLRACLTSESGMSGYLGTKDARLVEARVKDDAEVRTVWEAMAYQVAREICAMAAAYPEKPDAVVLTGGLARSVSFTESIRVHTGFLGRHLVYPGEDEMEALAAGALRVIRGEEAARVYPEIEAAVE